MTKWREVKIKDLGKVVGGGTPSTKREEYWNGDIPWLSPKDLSNHNNRYVGYGSRNITKKGLKNSSTRLLPKGTLLFTSRAPIGYIAIAKNEICTNQGFKNIVCNSNLVNVNFLYYYLKINIDYIKLFATGATFPEISAKRLKNIKIKIPDLKTQEKIAKVLSTYDELIENNNRRIELLEQMAEEIYKEWFVRMRFPGHEETKFEKGIPEGWEIKKMGDVADIKYGKNLPTNKLLKSGYEVFGGNGVIGYYKEYMYKEPKILISCRGAASGKIVISNEYSFVTNNSLVLNSISRRYFEYFKLYFMNQDLTPYITGSAQPQITITNIGKMKVIIPDEKLIDELNAQLVYISSNITLLHKQNQNLIKQRDMLLPRLMNGTIEVE